MKNSIIFFSYTLTLILFILTPAFANEEDRNMSIVNSGEDLVISKSVPDVFDALLRRSERSYAASRRQQLTVDAPAFVSVITAEDISRHGYTTLGDALKSLAGFYVTYDRNYEYLGVRGFSRPGDYNSRLLVLVNGHIINDAVYNSTPIGTDFPIDMGSIEQIEVIRGPGSALYGTSAIFAVVNVITKKAYNNMHHLEASSAYGTSGKTQGYLSYADRFGTSGEVFISASGMNTKGGKLYFDEFKDSPSRGYTKDTDYDRNCSFLSTYSWDKFLINVCKNWRENGVPTASWGTKFDDDRTRTLDSYAVFEIGYEDDISSKGKLSFKTYFNRYKYYGFLVYDDPDYPFFRETHIGTRCGTEGQLSWKDIHKNDIVTGFDLQYRAISMIQAGESYEGELVYQYPDIKKTSGFWAIYAQDQFHLTDDFTITLGAHHDQYDTFGGITNPRLAIVYKLPRFIAVKMSYGQAFKAPSPYELYYSDDGTIVGNESLSPETTRSYEIGVEKIYDFRFWGRLSAYYNEVDDLITQATNSDGILQFQNKGDVKAKGIELDMRADSFMKMSIYLNGSYQISKYRDTGDELNNSPRSCANFGISRPFCQNKIICAYDARYVGSRLSLDPEVKIDGYIVTNLSVIFNNLFNRLNISARIYNLLDNEYEDPGSGEHEMLGIQQDGRRYLIELTYRF